LPISQEQLRAEVEGIYSGLVMIEAKCMDTEAQKASQSNDELSTEQWQALVALHITLLHEHHDVLMATQHLSTDPSLVGLAETYSMPARMGKHGIYTFLELLGHYRPHSQEHMITFIHIAYQMVSLLLETAPRLTDTWVECLGDLARYRMAIEEDREIHTVWGGVARHWYVKAADRQPSFGRLYHHSGILEKPSLHKFYLYGRALTSIVPFLNAKESLSTLCTLIVEDEQIIHEGSKSLDALVICFHARRFFSKPTGLVGQAYSATLAKLDTQPEETIGTLGVPLAVTNTIALLGFGSTENIYRQLFDSALGQDVLDPGSPQSRSPVSRSTENATSLNVDRFQRPADSGLDFCYGSFNSILRREPCKQMLPGLLPYVHVMLVFIKSLHTLRSRLRSHDIATGILDGDLPPDRLDWSALASFLNHIAKSFSILPCTESYCMLATIFFRKSVFRRLKTT
jgi:hypothetical protein